MIPPGKLVVGLDAAGYDWVGDQARPITFAQATELAASHGVEVQFDPLSRSPWFRYTDGKGTPHEVWFENAASSEAKRSVAASFGVHGVFLWMFGPPDPAIWAALGTPARPHGRRPVIPVWLLALGIVGLNFTVWGLVGLCRLVDEQLIGRWRRRRRRAAPGGPS